MVLVKFNNLGLALGMALKFDHCGKKFKTKSQRVFGTNSFAGRSDRGKTGKGKGPFCTPILNTVKGESPCGEITKIGCERGIQL